MYTVLCVGGCVIVNYFFNSLKKSHPSGIFLDLSANNLPVGLKHYSAEKYVWKYATIKPQESYYVCRYALKYRIEQPKRKLVYNSTLKNRKNNY